MRHAHVLSAREVELEIGSRNREDFRDWLIREAAGYLWRPADDVSNGLFATFQSPDTLGAGKALPSKCHWRAVPSSLARTVKSRWWPSGMFWRTGVPCSDVCCSSFSR